MKKIEEKIIEKFDWLSQLQVILPAITKYRSTYILNNPEKMTAEEIKAFSRLLGIPATELITDFDCGKEELTISQAEELTKYQIA